MHECKLFKNTDVCTHNIYIYVFHGVHHVLEQSEGTCMWRSAVYGMRLIWLKKITQIGPGTLLLLQNYQENRKEGKCLSVLRPMYTKGGGEEEEGEDV